MPNPSLVAYRKKRTLDKSREPSGQGSSSQPSANAMQFVVQRHQASHLHYDFRIELDGVLKSWAVPKGPPPDPSVKRLAMQVEDHPVEYAAFEGTIPEGNYGAGEVKIWDRGVYHSSNTESSDPQENLRRLRDGLAKGHLDLLLYGDKLRGRYSLIKVKSRDAKRDNAWLFIKHNEAASPERAPDPMPHKVKPMLSTPVEEPFDRAGWFFEVKWDGYRAIAEVDDDRIALYSRNGLPFNDKYPQVVDALKHIHRPVVLDGEIVAVVDGKPSFHALQNVEEKPAPLQYVVFDILYLDGRDLRKTPLRERKEILADLLPKNPVLVYGGHIEETGVIYFEEISKLGMEGIIAKDSASLYEEGRRSGSWLKIKARNEQEAFVAGFTEPKGSRKGIGSLVLAVREGDHLKYVGHSGGGFTEKELEAIHERLKKIAIPESPFREKIRVNGPVTWVKPEIVCQLKFTEWTPDGRMRHPIFIGFREDKSAAEVVRETPQPANRSMPTPKFTNLNKVFWPDEGYTKGDVIAYYDSVADVLLPHLIDRPESLRRQPNGIADDGFFHKDMTTRMPEFVRTTKVYSETNDKTITYILCQNRETLLYMANLGCIELNPWLSRINSIEHPDFTLIDLDPGDAPFDDLVVTAQTVHEVFDQLHAACYCKTSGKSGLHIVVPLGGVYDYDQSRVFAETIARFVQRQLPKLTSVERTPSKRGGKIYVDYLQNRRGQTIAAPYSLRPCPGATVSTPLSWDEVKKGLRPQSFTIKTTGSRIQSLGDIWKPVLTGSFNLEQSIKILKEQ